MVSGAIGDSPSGYGWERVHRGVLQCKEIVHMYGGIESELFILELDHPQRRCESPDSHPSSPSGPYSAQDQPVWVYPRGTPLLR